MSNMRSNSRGLLNWIPDLLGNARGPLAPEVAARVLLHAWTGNYAMAISYEEVSRSVAVARLSLAAIARPDIAEQVREAMTSQPMSPSPALDWPPRATVVALLDATREVMMGHTALVGPGGIRVEHVTRYRGPD